jgi:DNA-binding SARP family transcriptional activator
MNRYPIQLAKVQPPPLRDETLARDRLLDWLATKIHDRVVLVLADAGYGKTTLLADFSRRTRLRTLWYRLEDDDRDWIAFLNHLVAAGQEHDPGFAPTTASMLADMSVGGPTRDSAIDVFLRELPAIAEHGAVLILDDFHLVDDSADVRLIVRELVARAPERMSVVFASRRPPTIPLARLRAAGEVAELGTDDLRFDATETRRLFSESYGRTLEPDVLADVVARTEGWAASLQLVQAALRDRTPTEIRRFVRGLSGADKELYDYLAEEVVGDLPDDLQQFLMRTSILQTLSAELAAVVVDIDATEVTRLTTAAERLTLLTRPTRSSQGLQRYHPLVREFLEARLRLTIGESEVAALHRRTAAAAASIDWRVAAHHYREAGDVELVGSVVASAIPEIMGSGQYVVAAEYMAPIPPNLRPAGLALVESRLAMQAGSYGKAIALSRKVLDRAPPGSQESDHALLNLATMHLHIGEHERALDFVGQLVASSRNSRLKLISDGMKLLVAAGSQGSIQEFSKQLLAMADQQRDVSPHYFGVSMLNLAIVAIAQDDPRLAVAYADQAIEALRQTSSRVEISSVLMARASALTMLGRFDEATAEIEETTGLGQVEATLERADLADTYSAPDDAFALLDEVDGNPDINANDRFALNLQVALYHARRGKHDQAASRLAEIDPKSGGLVIAQRTTRLVVTAYVAIANDSPDGPELAALAGRAAKHQRADHWRRIAYLLESFSASTEEFSAAVASTAGSLWNVTFVADLVARRLGELDDRAISTVAEAGALHPGRWRFVLRDQVAKAGSGEGLVGARLLETIGERSDIKRLRAYARRQRRQIGTSSLGRVLARRLADRVFVEDQNRVSIRIGPRQVSGSSIRRKVLALVCFLMTKPDLASTRDQALEALWPDLDPLDAVNSLNQTVYFLRRILEEDYVEDLSPGYLNHDSDLIWFDRDLVTSRSNECRRLIKSLPPTPSPDQVLDLAMRYAGRFALDFEYEDWAAPYRDWLHASFLEVVERAVTTDMGSGHFERGITLARRVLDIDPTAEQVEVSLLRLYRASGAHAAAAEQYGHYVAMMRDQLGLEPPPLDAL